MSAQQDLLIKIRGDINDIQSKLATVQKSVGNTQKSFAGIGNAFKTVGKTVAIAGAAVGAAATAIGAKSLSAAANVEEMENKFNVVFKETAKEADAWAKDFADAIGRSDTEIKEAISNQADLMIGMGMTEDVASDLSKKYTELAYDLGSFNNVNDAQALEAMTKAMFGETEAAKSLGLNLNATTMENSEYVKSLGKSWSSLTQAERAEAYYQESLKQSVNAIGDAKRSADSYTNQVKRLKSNMQELYETIGKYLLPVFTPLVTKMGDALKNMSDVVQKFGEAYSATGKLGDGFKAISGDLDAFKSTMLNSINTSLASLAESLPQFMSKGSEIVANLVNGIAAQLPIIITSARSVLLSFMQGLIDNAGLILESAANLVLGLATGIANALPLLIPKATETVLAFVNGLISQVPTMILAALRLITGLADGILSAIPVIIAQAPVLVKNLVDGLIDSIPLLIEAALNIIDGLIDFLTNSENLNKLLNSMFECIDSISNGLIQAIPMLVDAAIQIIDALITFITTPGNLSKLIQTSLLLIAKIAEGIIRALPVFISSALKLVSTITDTLLNTNWFSVGADILAGIGKGIMSGVGQIASNLGNSLMNGVKSVLGIHSPSREFKKIGVFTMQGLEGGIDDETHTVDMQMKELGTGLMNSFSSNASLDVNGMIADDQGMMANNSTTINLTGSYMFQDKESMDYFMNKLALAVQRG